MQQPGAGPIWLSWRIFDFWAESERDLKAPVYWWGFGHLRYLSTLHPIFGLSKPWPMPIWPFFGLHLIRTLLWLHTLSPSCGKSRADNLYLPAVTTCLSPSQLPGIPVANYRFMKLYHWASFGKWCSLQLAPFFIILFRLPCYFEVVGLSLNLVFWTPGITKALRAWLWSKVERRAKVFTIR